MLEKLAENHKEWLRIAKGICGNKQDAEDLVQDMYIKIHECNKKYKEINKWYIYRIMLNQFLNQVKKQKIKVIQIDFIENLENKSDNIQYLNQLQAVDDALNEIGLIDKRYLIETHTRSLRKNKEYLNIPVMTLHYRKQRALEKIKRAEAIKKFKKL